MSVIVSRTQGLMFTLPSSMCWLFLILSLGWYIGAPVRGFCPLTAHKGIQEHVWEVWEEEKRPQKPPGSGENDALGASECTWESNLLILPMLLMSFPGEAGGWWLAWDDHDSSPTEFIALTAKAVIQSRKENRCCAEEFSWRLICIQISPGTLLKCRFWSNRFGMEPKLLHFLKAFL